ncbi:hypothetical protein CSA17_02725 [bacterium DOLJORAL78_65_58]|nr:MAG: hypothetical protein CSA17_02725 [bacterium DOLJORAL78_65_58]
MAKSFTVNIVTPDKTAYEGQALSATIPGTNGYLGVWANHAPLVGGVVPGVVFLRTDESGSEKHFAVGEGFVEISDNQVNVMTATCELASDGSAPVWPSAGPKPASRPVSKAEHRTGTSGFGWTASGDYRARFLLKEWSDAFPLVAPAVRPGFPGERASGLVAGPSPLEEVGA